MKAKKLQPDLYAKTIKGGYLFFLLKVIITFLGFAKSIIIAKHLHLENLGLVAVSIMLVSLLNTFSESGFERGLIQKKGEIDSYLDSIWVVNILRGIVLFSILFFITPVIVHFKVPQDKVSLAIAIIRVMGINFIIGGFRNIGVVFFQKELQFHKTFMLSLLSQSADIIISISLVVIFRSVWAYVIGRLVASCISCVGSYLLSSFRPKLDLNLSKIKELWGFGKWIFGGKILGFFLEEGDDFFVWFLIDLPSLALYRYAFNLSSMPATHFTSIVTSISFPAYSKIQSDIVRLKAAYLKVLQMTTVVVTPISFLIFYLGADFVLLFLPHMSGMILALQILSIKGLFRAVGATRFSVFLSLGQVRFAWFLKCLRLLIFAVTIYPFTKKWGIEGTAMATLLMTLLTTPIALWKLCGLLQCRLRDILKPSIHCQLAALSMLVAIGFIQCKCNLSVNYVSLFSLGIMGLSFYTFFLFVYDRFFHADIWLLIKQQYTTVLKKGNSR